MFKRILLPLDGSKRAEAVIPWVIRYAKISKAIVYPIRVIGSVMLAEQYAYSRFDFVESYLNDIAKRFNAECIPAKPISELGTPADTLVHQAMSRRCDLIAMTSRGESGVARWLLGGTVERVVQMSSIPVLVAKFEIAGRVKQILVPLDGSFEADSVIPAAVAFAKFHKAAIAFLHVRPASKKAITPEYSGIYSDLERRTGFLCQSLGDARIRAQFEVNNGDAAEQILLQQSCLVAMTTHGYSGFKRLLLGSVAEKVIHHSASPIFIYRGPCIATKQVRDLAVKTASQ